MRTQLPLLIFLLGVLGLSADSPPFLGAQSMAPAVPLVFASPINAGCVQVTPSMCQLHVDPFTIQVGSGQRLQAFQLRANGNLLYDFRTDTSNPPVGSYTPSAVKLDFAATCGQTYTVNLLARDSGDVGFLNAGQAEDIICPEGAYTLFLPALLH